MESTLSVGYTQSRIWTYLGTSGHVLPTAPVRILLSSLRTRGREANCLVLCHSMMLMLTECLSRFQAVSETKSNTPPNSLGSDRHPDNSG